MPNNEVSIIGAEAPKDLMPRVCHQTGWHWAVIGRSLMSHSWLLGIQLGSPAVETDKSSPFGFQLVEGRDSPPPSWNVECMLPSGQRNRREANGDAEKVKDQLSPVTHTVGA